MLHIAYSELLQNSTQNWSKFVFKLFSWHKKVANYLVGGDDDDDDDVDDDDDDDDEDEADDGTEDDDDI